VGDIINVLKLVAQAGSAGLLGLMVWALYKLGKEFLPQALTAWNRQTKVIASLAAKVDENTRAWTDARSRASQSSNEVAEISGKLDVVLATGQHQAVQAERPPMPSRPDTDRR